MVHLRIGKTDFEFEQTIAISVGMDSTTTHSPTWLGSFSPEPTETTRNPDHSHVPQNKLALHAECRILIHYVFAT